MNHGLLSAARPTRVLLLAMLVPALGVPLVVAALMKYYGVFVGDLEISLFGSSRERFLDPRWFLPIAGVLSLVGYALMASIALLFTRRLSFRIRNSVVLALVPLYFAAVWLFVASKS